MTLRELWKGLQWWEKTFVVFEGCIIAFLLFLLPFSIFMAWYFTSGPGSP